MVLLHFVKIVNVTKKILNVKLRDFNFNTFIFVVYVLFIYEN